jgi:hypothetical protein
MDKKEIIIVIKCLLADLEGCISNYDEVPEYIQKSIHDGYTMIKKLEV